MFIDQAEILVRSGKGGDGMVHFHREKYVPRGGAGQSAKWKLVK
jgi:GTP-binding protein